MIAARPPFTGIQLDSGAYRARDPDALCSELRATAEVDALFCFHDDRDLRRGPVAADGIAWGEAERAADGSTAIDRLCAAAERHAMRVYLGGGELGWGDAERYCADARQVDCFGAPRASACVNHPDWRAFQIAAHVGAFAQQPALAGLLFMHERAGPFLQIFKPEAWQGAFNPGCFCRHCCALGAERGIDVAAARRGLAALVTLYRDGGEADFRDGALVALWRVLTRHPEALAWERLQWESLYAYRSDLAKAIRAARPGAEIGHHCQHGGTTADLPWRAGEAAEDILAYADWIKPSVYPGCSGKRYRDLIDRYRETWLRDCDDSGCHRSLSAWFGRDPATGRDVVDQPAGTQVAFGPDYVYAEVARMVAASGERPVYAGLGIGIPGGERADSVALIRDCAEACFDAGAAGLLLSRHYSEMPADQLAAAGAVIRARRGGAAGATRDHSARLSSAGASSSGPSAPSAKGATG